MIKKAFLFFVTLLLLVIIYIGYSYFFKTNIDISVASTEMIVSAEELTEHYIKNNKKANALYRDKVIEVHGTVKEITFQNKTNTIILQSDHKNFNVLCDMHYNSSKDMQNLVKGQSVVVKGICKGFLHDVILLNCILINTINNE